MSNEKIDDAECRRILSLFEMSERASRDDADEHTKNEAANAVVALLRLLAKYGLTIGDIPELQTRHEQAQAAAKTTASTASAPNRNQPTALELTHHILQGYIDVQPHEYVAIALWILHTHVFDHFQISPRLAPLSPDAGCGKSKTLQLIAKLAANPERHDSISAASLFRLIENAAPSLLLDEGDNLGLKIDRNMRAVLNSGHLKGGVITRTIKGEPKSFSTFAPAAIAAIGTLPLPLMTRSIVILMHPSKRDLETIDVMNSPEQTQRFEALRRHIVEWAQGVALDFNPPLPKILRGRAADNWRVLISIADSFGSAHWSEIAREAAVAFADGYFDVGAAVAILIDIRTIFRQLNADRIKSAILAAELHALEDGVGIWSAWRGEADDTSPHAITQGEIALLLRRFDRRNLRPRTIFELGSRKDRGKAGRGYYREQFEKWWTLYCPKDEDDNAADNVRQLRTKAK
jgi:hypothetical protein